MYFPDRAIPMLPSELSSNICSLLPDQDLGVGGTLNPFAIGVLVVLIAAIGFIGYIAIRLLGVRRGLGVTGLAGGALRAEGLVFAQPNLLGGFLAIMVGISSGNVMV